MKVAIYARYSSYNQREGWPFAASLQDSPSAQLKPALVTAGLGLGPATANGRRAHPERLPLA